MPLAPAIVSDGNFRTPQQNGATNFSYPFAESRMDFKTFVASRLMRVEDGSFQMPEPMSQMYFSNQGIAYLVGISTPTIVEGTNLLEYTEQYASLPPTQRVPGQATATIQQIINLANDGDPPRYFPQNISDLFDAVFVYEYTLNEPLESLYRSRLIQYPYGITNSLVFGLAITQPPANGLYLAQNSTSSIWKGGIYCRESIFVRPPPIGKWSGVIGAP